MDGMNAAVLGSMRDSPPPHLEGETRHRLRRLARRHDVKWEVWPRRHVSADGELYPVGYDLELLGVHDHPSHAPHPGCDECRLVFRALREIAKAIIPDADTESRYEVAMFDRALHHAPKRDLRPEVRLTISILHREGYSRPLDDCEVRCLRRMKKALVALGVREG